MKNILNRLTSIYERNARRARLLRRLKADNVTAREMANPTVYNAWE